MSAMQWYSDSSEEDIGSGLWINSKYKDFHLIIDNDNLLILEAHKSVLTVRSPIFATIITHSAHLIIQDFDFDTVEKAIKFCYSKLFGIETEIKIETIWKLLKFGNKYKIDHLIKACLHQINRLKNNFDDYEKKFIIKSAVEIGCDEILDTILKIFGIIKGDHVFNSFYYPGLGEALMLDDTFKDMKITCDDGQEFFVHKCILAMKSTIFKEIFENYDDNIGLFHATKIESIIFENAVKLSYTGHITNEYEPLKLLNIIIGLLDFADRFKIEELASSCLKNVQRIKNQIDVDHEIIYKFIEITSEFESKKIFQYILGIFGTPVNDEIITNTTYF